MIVCLCKAVSDREIRRTVELGAGSVREPKLLSPCADEHYLREIRREHEGRGDIGGHERGLRRTAVEDREAICRRVVAESSTVDGTSFFRIAPSRALAYAARLVSVRTAARCSAKWSAR